MGARLVACASAGPCKAVTAEVVATTALASRLQVEVVVALACLVASPLVELVAPVVRRAEASLPQDAALEFEGEARRAAIWNRAIFHKVPGAASQHGYRIDLQVVRNRMREHDAEPNDDRRGWVRAGDGELVGRREGENVDGLKDLQPEVQARRNEFHGALGLQETLAIKVPSSDKVAQADFEHLDLELDKDCVPDAEGRAPGAAHGKILEDAENLWNPNDQIRVRICVQAEAELWTLLQQGAYLEGGQVPLRQQTLEIASRIIHIFVDLDECVQPLRKILPYAEASTRGIRHRQSSRRLGQAALHDVEGRGLQALSKVQRFEGVESLTLSADPRRRCRWWHATIARNAAEGARRTPSRFSNSNQSPAIVFAEQAVHHRRQEGVAQADGHLDVGCFATGRRRGRKVDTELLLAHFHHEDDGKIRMAGRASGSFCPPWRPAAPR
mmetsp:Transcript_117724/g.375235  ORF Transcript_117724/g.375235 Transcript_117724/m.375235 type:complete len:443 (-) Transcript_117724:1713-3041(-)